MAAIGGCQAYNKHWECNNTTKLDFNLCFLFCFIALCHGVISTITTFPSKIFARAFGLNASRDRIFWNIRVLFPNFRSRASCEKCSKDNKNNYLHLARKYARIFVLGQIELRSRKTVRFWYNVQGISPRQMEAIVYVYSIVHCSTRMGLSEYRTYHNCSQQ